MPNRIIKESICRSDTINSLKPFEEVLFYRLIVVCDDYGRFDGRPEIIKGSCFPLKDTAVKDIGAALKRLVEVGLVDLYEVHGKPVLQLSTWSAHQQIRAKKSKYPAPENICNQLISNDITCPRNRESRIENRESRIETRAREGEVRLFEDFIAAYPKNCNRHLTEHKYVSLLLTGKVTGDELVKCAKNYAEDCKILGTQEKYIKNSENFLKEFVFEKYLPENYKKPTPQKAKRNFNNIEQHDYNFEELEKSLFIN